MNTRTVIRIATLGALWGVLEMTLGSAMHAAHVPFLGTWMTAIGIGIALVGASVTRKPGTVLGIAVVAALLKLFSFGGGSILSAMLAIAIEGLLAEAGLRMFKYRASAASFVVAMTLAQLWDVVHPVLIGGALMGRSMAESSGRMLKQAEKVFGVTGLIALVGALVLLRIVVGVAGGLVSWSVAQAVRSRMGTPE